MQDEKLSDQLEIVITEPATLTTNQPEWTIRNLCPNDLKAVCEICRESFPLEYSDSWFEEVCSGRFISFGLFNFGDLTGLLVAELKLLANCDVEVCWSKVLCFITFVFRIKGLDEKIPTVWSIL